MKKSISLKLGNNIKNSLFLLVLSLLHIGCFSTQKSSVQEDKDNISDIEPGVLDKVFDSSGIESPSPSSLPTEEKNSPIIDESVEIEMETKERFEPANNGLEPDGMVIASGSNIDIGENDERPATSSAPRTTTANNATPRSPSPIVPVEAEAALIDTMASATKPSLEESCIAGKYDQGVIAFDTIPSEMYLNQSYEVIIEIDHLKNLDKFGNFDRDELLAKGEVQGGAKKIHTTEIWNYMKVEIIAEDTTGLLIKDVFASGSSDGFQRITCDMPASWKFNIKPLKEGKQKVFFNVYVSEDGKVIQPFGKGSRSREISVIVIKSFMERFGWLIFGGLGLVAALGVFLFFRKKKKQEQVVISSFSKEELKAYQKMISEGETEDVLDTIIDKLGNEDSDLKKQALQYQANLHQIESQNNMNLLDAEFYSKEISRVTNAVIEMVSDLGDREG